MCLMRRDDRGKDRSYCSQIKESRVNILRSEYSRSFAIPTRDGLGRFLEWSSNYRFLLHLYPFLPGSALQLEFNDVRIIINSLKLATSSNLLAACTWCIMNDYDSFMFLPLAHFQHIILIILIYYQYDKSSVNYPYSHISLFTIRMFAYV